MEKNKSFWDVFLTPLIIAIVGLLGTFFITRQQIKSAELSMKAQIESAERQAKSAEQVKLLEIFSEKITDPDSTHQEIAVRILSALNKDLADKLAKVIFESSNNATIRNLANQYLWGKYCVVIGSYQTSMSAKSFAETLELKHLPYAIKIYRIPKGMYAVCIGNPVTNEEANSILNFTTKLVGMKNSYIKLTDGWCETRIERVPRQL